MTAEEFKEISIACGYGTKKQVDKYISGKSDFAECDFIALYRQSGEIGRPYGSPKWRDYEGTRTTKRLINIADDKEA